AASVPGQILVWPSAQAKSPVAFPSPLGLVAGVRVALSRNGRLLADASGARVEVRSLGGGRGVPRTSAPRPVGGGNGAIRSLAFSDDGRTVAVGLEEPAGGRALTLFDAASGAPLGSPYEGFGGAPRLAFGDGYLAATGIFGIAILDDILWSDVGAMRRRLCSI